MDPDKKIGKENKRSLTELLSEASHLSGGEMGNTVTLEKVKPFEHFGGLFIMSVWTSCLEMVKLDVHLT